MYGRGQKEPSFSSRPALTVNTAISQRCSEPVEMTWLQHFCLAVGWRETRRKIDCIVFGEYRDIDCQSEMSLSISPHLHIPARVDIFRETGAFLFFCSFLALARCSHLRIVAFIWPAEHSAPATLLITCSLVNYNRLIGIEKTIYNVIECVFTWHNQ